MSKLTAAEQAQIETFVREHGTTKCPRVRELADLRMVPRRGGQRGASSRFGRGKREFLDRVNLPDLPAN